ncbi:hypothetical protein CJU89_6706 [Yarrowia sp. B02]|nr:hypothetical protein CJU89_6706 [Yarrowia sp. B02]
MAETEAVNSSTDTTDTTIASKTICTDDEVKKLIMEAVATGYLEGVGTFTLAYDGKTDHKRSDFRLSLLRDSGQLVYCKMLLVSPSFPQSICMLDRDTLLVLFSEEKPAALLVSTSSWREFTTIPPSHTAFHPRLTTSTKPVVNTLNHTSNLRKVRLKGKFDFSIVCDDDEEIKVHSSILSAQWPFFDKMLESDMSEAATNTLKLPYPRAWIEALVSHFYDEQNDIDIDTASGLIIVAQVYDVPRLLTLAMRRLKETDLDIHQALVAWKRADSVDNKAVRVHCASRISKLMARLPGSETSKELVNDMSQQEFVHLFHDMSLSAEAAEKLAEAEVKVESQ